MTADTRHKSNGSSLMRVTREIILQLASRIPETTADTNIAQHPVWIVVAPFRAMSYLDDKKYLPGDEAPESEELWKEWKINFEFNQIDFPSSATSFTPYELLAVRALGNLKYVEGLFVHYGDNYDINYWNSKCTLQVCASSRMDAFIAHCTLSKRKFD